MLDTVITLEIIYGMQSLALNAFVCYCWLIMYNIQWQDADVKLQRLLTSETRALSKLLTAEEQLLFNAIQTLSDICSCCLHV